MNKKYVRSLILLENFVFNLPSHLSMRREYQWWFHIYFVFLVISETPFYYLSHNFLPEDFWLIVWLMLQQSDRPFLTNLLGYYCFCFCLLVISDFHNSNLFLVNEDWISFFSFSFLETLDSSHCKHILKYKVWFDL